MINYCFILQYDGTAYNGWQKQGNTEKTIQGLLEETVSSLLSEKVDIKGSGRTDRGVHARKQVANCYASKRVEDDWLKDELNKCLPADVRVIRVLKKPLSFHSRKSAQSKTYEYCIYNSTRKNVFSWRYCCQVEQSLDLKSMRVAAKKLEGTHDFLGFSSLRDTKKSTVRTIEKVEIIKEGEMIRILFTGDGFLYHMVRILTGTLLMVGQGKMEVSQIERILESRDRELAGPTAPAQGLKLVDVVYEKKD